MYKADVLIAFFA